MCIFSQRYQSRDLKLIFEFKFMPFSILGWTRNGNFVDIRHLIFPETFQINSFKAPFYIFRSMFEFFKSGIELAVNPAYDRTEILGCLAEVRYHVVFFQRLDSSILTRQINTIHFCDNVL